jgi:AAA15 family ATPase/GTPase
MVLREIEIENFRGISRASINDFQTINLFVGKNNACKTSVLEAIFLSIGVSNPRLPLSIDAFRQLVHTEEDDFRFIFYNLDYNNSLVIKSRFDNTHCRDLKIYPIFRGEILTNTQSIDNSSSMDINANGISLDFTVKEKNNSEKKYASNIIFEGGRFTSEIADDYSEVMRGAFLTNGIVDHKKLENIIIQKKQNPLIQALKKIDPSIDNIVIGGNNMIYVDIGIQRLIPINLLGDGLKRLLYILVAIADSKDGIVLIDEIENGLHFSAQKVLWASILEASKMYNVQLFITSHSKESLFFLKEVLHENDYQDFQNATACYYLRKDDTNTLKSYKYNFDKFEYAIEQDIELRDL